MSGTHAGPVLRPRPAAARVLIATSTIIAIAVAWAGQPVVVVGLILFLSTARLADRYGWLLSWAISLTLGALGLVGVLTAATAVPVDLGVLVTTIWTVLAVALAGAQLFRPSPTLTRPALTSLAEAALVPVALAAVFVVHYVRSGGGWIAWAMNNDVASRTRVVRWTLADGGTREHSSPDPLTTLLNTAWSSRGYDGNDPADSLGHIVVQSAQASMLVWLAVSLTVAALALASLQGRPAGVRVVCAAAVALLPWTWFMAGYAFEYGFQNAGPSVLLLLAAWLVWRGGDAHPVVSCAMLVLVTVALVMTWAPLGVVGTALLGAHLLRQRRSLLRAPWWGWAVVVASLGVAGVFAVTVTLATLRRSSSGDLANEGAMLTFYPVRTLVVSVVLVVVGAIAARRAPSSRGAWFGAAFALTGVAAACAVLLYLRRDSPTLWGYYPVKFVWLVACATILVLAASSVAIAGRLSASWWRGNGTVLVIGVAVAGMLMISPKPPTTDGYAAPLNLVNTSAKDVAGRSVLDLFDQRHPSVVSRYSQAFTGTADDAFTNFWLLQMDAADGDDRLRGYALTLDPTSTRAVCEVAKVLIGRSPIIWTSVPEHQRTTQAFCTKRGRDAQVRLVPPPPAYE